MVIPRHGRGSNPRVPQRLPEGIGQNVGRVKEVESLIRSEYHDTSKGFLMWREKLRDPCRRNIKLGYSTIRMCTVTVWRCFFSIEIWKAWA